VRHLAWQVVAKHACAPKIASSWPRDGPANGPECYALVDCLFLRQSYPKRQSQDRTEQPQVPLLLLSCPVGRKFDEWNLLVEIAIVDDQPPVALVQPSNRNESPTGTFFLAGGVADERQHRQICRLVQVNFLTIDSVSSTAVSRSAIIAINSPCTELRGERLAANRTSSRRLVGDQHIILRARIIWIWWTWGSRSAVGLESNLAIVQRQNR